MLDSTSISSLLGSSTTSAVTNLTDGLINGNTQGVASLVQNSLAQQPSSSLTSTQQSSIASLTSFVNENVEGADAERLLESIAALESLLQLGNSDFDTRVDPIFSLLAENPSIISAENANETGLIIDQLL